MRSPLKSCAIVLLIAATYFMGGSETLFANETSNSIKWLTYRDPNSPFTINYPSNCTMVDSRPNFTSFFFSDGPMFNVSYQAGSTISGALSSIKNNITGECSDLASSVSVDGLPSQKMNCERGFFDNAGSQEEVFYFIPNDGNVLFLNYTTGRSKEKNSAAWISTFNQMIASVHFVSLNSSKSEWSEYSDPIKHFSITYPSGWRRSSGFNGAAEEVSFQAIGKNYYEYFKVMVFRDRNFKTQRKDLVTNCQDKPIIIDGKNATQCIYWGRDIIYFIEDSGQLFGLVLGNQAEKRILEKMVKTFRFQH